MRSVAERVWPLKGTLLVRYRPNRGPASGQPDAWGTVPVLFHSGAFQFPNQPRRCTPLDAVYSASSHLFALATFHL